MPSSHPQEETQLNEASVPFPSLTVIYMKQDFLKKNTKLAQINWKSHSKPAEPTALLWTVADAHICQKTDQVDACICS